MELVILFTHLFIFALSIIFSSVNYQNMIEHTLTQGILQKPNLIIALLFTGFRENF